MKMSKLVKGLLFALPIIAITACSSTDKGVERSTDDMSTKARAELQELQQVNTIYFGFDKYNIGSDFTEILDAHAAFLRAHPGFSIVVQGYTDERGTPEYNIALGERRANAVKAYLQGRGVAASQISIVSFGKEKPAVLGHTESAYAKNRRAVIVY